MEQCLGVYIYQQQRDFFFTCTPFFKNKQNPGFPAFQTRESNLELGVGNPSLASHLRYFFFIKVSYMHFLLV
jgi:hypothetical protein